jgi:inosose dehydratase
VTVLDRVAGAPISWGVCEVPGWGSQLPVDVVLGAMRELGLAATELGPDGFLPVEAAEKAAVLETAGLRAVGGFVPVVLHDPALDVVREVRAAVDGLVACGAPVVVLAAASGRDGYDTRPTLDEGGWSTVTANLDRLDRYVADRGLRATLHPHVGTMVESADEVRRVLEGSGIALCLDTGHLLIGGADPVALAREHGARVAHVHLKDVDAAGANKVRSGEVAYADAVALGLYRPLGQGDVDVASIVTALEEAGYTGWYVLEQDTVLDEPATRAELSATGPTADVRSSLDFLRTIA